MDTTKPLERGAAGNNRPQSPPAWIGPYEILEVLGSGGMGSVFLGRQSTPIERRVAVKVLRIQSSADDFAARFDLERRALERMNHPAIASILDAGRGEDGEEQP